MHDATDNAPIVCTLDASHIRRQMRLNPLPLLIAQPKKVLSHGPDPPKRIKHIWNQDCFATAAKLMSSHSSTHRKRNSNASSWDRSSGVEQFGGRSLKTAIYRHFIITATAQC